MGRCYMRAYFVPDIVTYSNAALCYDKRFFRDGLALAPPVLRPSPGFVLASTAGGGPAPRDSALLDVDAWSRRGSLSTLQSIVVYGRCDADGAWLVILLEVSELRLARSRFRDDLCEEEAASCDVGS